MDNAGSFEALGSSQVLDEPLIEHKTPAKISLADFRSLVGADLDQRLTPFFDWQAMRRAQGTWVFDKTVNSAPLPHSISYDGCGRAFTGANYCSQDYLSLASHPAVKAAAVSAIERYGVHSAGSSALLGNTETSRWLEGQLSAFTGYERVLLFPTGWAAGYGVVKGLVRDADWVVMDALSHACLQEGARGATEFVASIPHLDNKALEQRLRRIRSKHPTTFILCITESLFSMDSDSPNLREFVDICRSYGAFSLVDVAHDLGCLGEGGRGVLENQDALALPDIIIGSFSKTFASNGGFIATKSPKVVEYLKMYSCPQTFSNAMSPVQASSVTAALAVVQSSDKNILREKLLRNSVYLRQRLEANDFICMGQPSAIVPVYLGDDDGARRLWRTLSESGIASNFVEFPGVAPNRARIRLQLQSNHNEADADEFVHNLVKARASI